MVQAGCILLIPTACGLTSYGPCWRDLFKGNSKFLIFRCRSNIKPILKQEEKMLDTESRSLSWFQHSSTSQQCGHRRLSTKSYCIILYQCHLIILLIHCMRDNFKRISLSAFVQMPKKNKRWPWNSLKVMVRDSGQARKSIFPVLFPRDLIHWEFWIIFWKNSCQRFMLCLGLIHTYQLSRIYISYLISKWSQLS